MSYFDRDERTGNYITDHWAGRHSLAHAYWINYVFFGSLTVIGGSLIAHSIANPDRSIQVMSAVGVATTALAIAIWIWGVVGVWRSATHHSDRGGSLGWANAARAMIVLGALTFAGQAMNLVRASTESTMLALNNDPLGPPIQISAEGDALRLSGPFSQGSGDKVIAALQAPNVKRVFLNSTGGRIHEAEKIARGLRLRSLETIVEGDCMSACTLVLLAGDRRSQMLGSRIGFHQTSFPGFTAEELTQMNADLRTNYVNAGLPSYFVDQALAHGPESMWLPDETELFSAGVLTGFSRERVVQDNIASAEQINSKGPIRLDELTTQEAARASDLTLTFVYRANVDANLLDRAAVRDELKKNATLEICDRPMARRMFASGSIYEHEYLDQNGRLLARYQITGCP